MHSPTASSSLSASSAGAECPWCGAVMTAGGTCVACLQALDGDTDEPSPLAEVGGCQLLEKLGRGGMGVVFKARQRSLDRIVAVKMLAGGPLASDTFVARFKAEAESAAGLQHPGLVAVHEVGEDESGTPWFSMDYIAGPSLAQRLKEGPLEPKEAARLTKLIAEAVHYAHGRGLLHRDLKPSNILLDEFEHPRVTDFGIARRMDDDSTLTVTGDILGSPAYMPPEQATGHSASVTAASDVYSLGAVLYEMLTGRAPFTAPSRAAVLEQVKNVEPLSPRRLNAAIPADLETVCLKCLEKEPSRRYATAAELADEMARFLRGDPVLAKPVSALGHSWRWARRHKAAAFAVASLFLGLTGVAAVSLIMNLRVTRAKSEAEHNYHESERHAAESRANLSRSYLLAAHRYLEGLDYQRALLWLLEAWETADEPAEKRLLGRSLSTTLRIVPQLEKVWAPGGLNDCAVFDPAGKRIACASGRPEVFIWSTDPADDTTMTITHGGNAYHCGFNADGTRLFTEGKEDVRLWDTATGREIGQAVPHLTRAEYFIFRREPVFSSDGNYLLTFTPKGAQLLDAGTGAAAGPLLPAPEPLAVAVMVPGGTRCLLGYEKQILLVDAVTGSQIAAWTARDRVHHLACDAQAQRFCALSGNATLGDIFSLAAPSAPPALFTSPGANYQVMFNPNGSQVLTTSFSGSARTFDAATGARLQIFTHDAGVSRAAWMPGRTDFAVVSSWDNTVRLWRSTDGHPVSILHHGGKTMSVDVTVSPARILTASADGSVRLYARPSDPTPLRVRDRVVVSRTSPATVGIFWVADNIIKMCHPSTGKAFGSTMLHRHKVLRASAASAAMLVASLTDDGTVHIWDAGTAVALPLATIPPSTPPVTSLTFSADGTRLLLVHVDGSFSLCNAKGKVMASLTHPCGKLRNPLSWSVSQNDRILAALGTDGKVQAWRMDDGQPAGPLFGPERGAWSLTVAPEGDAVCLNDGPPDTNDVRRAVQLWDPVSGRALAPPMEHYDDIGVVAFSPDGRLVATGGEDFQVIIWDRRTGQQAASSWQHSSWPRLLTFNPDSSMLAVVGQDSTFAFLRSADCTLVGPRRQWASPPHFITFTEGGDSLLAIRSDDPNAQNPMRSIYEVNLSAVDPDPASVRDEVTLTSGMTLQKDGVVRMLSAAELVALWRKLHR